MRALSWWNPGLAKGWQALLLVLALALSVPVAAKPGFPVLGYLPMYDATGPYGDSINLSDASAFPWDRMTHVIEAFAQPSSTGTISFPIPQRANLVLMAHLNNTRCLLSVGGAGSSNATWSTAVSTAALRTAFVTNLVAACTTYGYDGIDIDWEFPNLNNATPADEANFTAFMTQLGAALAAKSSSCSGCAFDTQPKQLTFFVSPGADICGVDWNNVALQNAVTFAVYGAYDFNAPPGYNSPTSMTWQQTDCRGVSYNFCLTNTTAVLTNGISPNYSWPKSKMVLSLPLYDKQVYSSFSTGTPVLVALRQGLFQGTDTPQDESRYTVGGATHYVNDSVAYCRKMSWGLKQGFAGFALWEISHAYPANAPEVTGLWATIGGTAACDSGIPTPTPAPTPPLLPGGLVDIGSSGTATNNWAGTWSTWVGTGSTVTMNYTAAGDAASPFNTSGPYSIQASGTLGSGGLSVSCALQPAGAPYNLDSNGYTRIDFLMKVTPGTYRLGFDRTATRATGNNHYGFDITVADNNWHSYSYYLANATQPAFGTPAPLAFNDVIAVVFAPESPTGAYQMNMDDIQFVKQVVTATPTPIAGLLDTVEDGNLTNNWGGIWSTWAPAGSTISLPNPTSAGFPFSAYGPKYSIGISGSNSAPNNPGTVSTGLTNTANLINLTAYNYIDFYVLGSGAGNSFGVQFTDGSTYWDSQTYTVPNDGNWYLVSLPLSFVPAANLAKVKSISWYFNGSGAYTMSVDDIWFEDRPPTPTPTSTPSFTPSPTATVSPSSSSTPSRTASPTPSASPSPSPTPSASPSGTTTASPSGTLTGTGSATPSVTGSPTITLTFTPPPSGSTATDTPTFSATWSASPSITGTPSTTPVDTVTATPTATVPALTATSTDTPSNNSPTDTPSATLTGSPSATPTSTLSPSLTATVTLTNTPPPPGSTATSTPSDTPLLTATPTASPTLTATLTNTPPPPGSSPTVSPTMTTAASGGGDGTLQILGGSAVPNPLSSHSGGSSSGGAYVGAIAIDLDGPADEIDVSFYTTSLVRADKNDPRLKVSGSFRAGWNAGNRVLVPADLMMGLPSGTYYYLVVVKRGTVKGLKPFIGKMVWLK